MSLWDADLEGLAGQQPYDRFRSSRHPPALCQGRNTSVGQVRIQPDLLYRLIAADSANCGLGHDLGSIWDKLSGRSVSYFTLRFRGSVYFADLPGSRVQ